MAYTAVPVRMALPSSLGDMYPTLANDWKMTRFPKEVFDLSLRPETDEVDLCA